MTDLENETAVAPVIEILDEHQPPVPIRLRGKDGADREYQIREMDGPDLSKWMEFISSRMKTNAKGRVVKRDFRGLQAELIWLCLYDAGGSRVPKETIRGWGAKVQNRLFELCQQQNGLTDKIEDDEGKD